MLTATRPRRRLVAGTALVLLLAGGTAACSADGSDDAKTDAKADKTSTTVERTSTTEADEATTTTEADDTSTTDAPGPDVSADDADEQDYVDALAATLTDDDAETFSKKQTTCLGGKFVDVIGVQKLKDAGVSPKEFAESGADDLPASVGIDDDKANELFDQFEACDIDLQESFTKSYSALGELTAKQKSCIAGVLSEKNLRASFVASFTGKTLEDDPLDAIDDCVAPAGSSGGN